MGSGTWSAKDWDNYSTRHVASKATVKDIYTARSIDNLLDPKGVKLRESCDSPDNPNSTPLIVGLDVTGSMGMLLDSMARVGLKTLAEEVYARRPIADPHIMFMGIGDVYCDDAPLQVTQFEADIRIGEQLTKLYLEQGGGGNNHESYTFPWYFAAMHTRIDCFEKRNKKGYLFTVGDEEPNPELLAEHVEKFLGYRPQRDYTAMELLDMVSRNYEVFHLIVEEGSHCRHSKDRVVREWSKLLGQRAILLSDHTKMGEVIVSTLQVIEGADKKDVISSWDGSTSLVVSRAVADLTATGKNSGGLVRL